MKAQRKKNGRSDAPPPRTRVPASPLQRAVTAAAVTFVAVRIVATVAGGGMSRTWGIDSAAYLSTQPDILLALVLPLVVLLPPVGAWCVRMLGTRGAASPDRLPRILLPVAIAGAILIAATVQVPFPYLGDGPYYLGDAFRVMHDAGGASGMLKPMAFLTGHLLVLLVRTFALEQVAAPFVIMGAAGAALTAAALVVGLRRERASVALPVATVVVSAPGTLLFLGYLELYAIGYALTASYLLLAWRVLRPGGRAAADDVASPADGGSRRMLIAAGVALLLAVGFTASAVVLLPSYLVLLVHHLRGGAGGPLLRRLTPARAAAVLCILMLAGFGAMLAVIDTTQRAAPLLPLVPGIVIADDGSVLGMQRYALLTAAHLADVVNILLLQLGVLVFVLAAVVLRGARGIDWRDASLAVFGTAAVGGLPIWLAGQSYFGLARDWDLTAIPLLAATMFVLALLVQLGERRALDLARTAPLLMLVALTSLWLWLRPNLDAEASARRFEDLIRQNAGELPPRETYVALEHLRKFRQASGDERKHRDVVRAMAETGHLPLESYRRLFISLMHARGSDGGDGDFTWLLERLVADLADSARTQVRYGGDVRDLDEFTTRVLLGAVQTGRADVADRFLARVAAVRPSWRGGGLVRVVRDPAIPPAEASALLASAIDDSTRDGELLVIAAGAYQQLGMDDRAIALLEQALQRQPAHYPSWYLALAGMYRTRGDSADRERDALMRCVERCAGTPEAAEARRLLAEMDGR